MIWYFGFFFLGLHDELDEGSQQRRKTLFALNMLCEIMLHPDRSSYFSLFPPCLFFASPGQLNCKRATHTHVPQKRQNENRQSAWACLNTQWTRAEISAILRFFSILLTHEGSHEEVYQDFQPSLTSSAGGAKG